MSFRRGTRRKLVRFASGYDEFSPVARISFLPAVEMTLAADLEKQKFPLTIKIKSLYLQSLKIR